MLTFQDCIDLAGVTEAEIEAIAKHERIPAMIALELADHMLRDGGVTVTVCQNQAGTDESIQLARNWIQQNASDLNTSPPVVAEGSALVHLS